MENPVVFAQHGVLRLPPGFRFHPTDEELVVQYLKRKVFSCPLPAAVIPEIDLGKYDPWDLPGVLEGERYFFNLTEAKNSNGGRPKRAAGTGYWKASGKDKPVMATGQLVGVKKVMVFHRGKTSRGARTGWTMHEYRLASLESRWKNSNHIPMVQTKDWVVCRVFKKSRGATRMHAGIRKQYSHREWRNHVGVIHIGSSSPSSSASSCVTDLSEESSDGEEGSSGAP